MQWNGSIKEVGGPSIVSGNVQACHCVLFPVIGLLQDEWNYYVNRYVMVCLVNLVLT